MDKKKIIERNYKEGLGRYYLKKGVDFAFDKSFGKSYEYLKEGLDIITCDCKVNSWMERFEESDKTLFNDLLIDSLEHKEYYFVKAYLLSFTTDTKYLYLALDAIENYLKITEDEYGLYVKSTIFLKLKDYPQAYETYLEAAKINTNPRLLYRIGRIKELHLSKNGVNDFYNSFNANRSSSCCARVLKKYMQKRGIIFPLENDESNKLLISFADLKIEFYFDFLFSDYLENELLNDDIGFPTIETLPEINGFIDQIIANSDLFAAEDEDDYEFTNIEDYPESEFDEEPDYERDNIDPLTDGQNRGFDDWKTGGK